MVDVAPTPAQPKPGRHFPWVTFLKVVGAVLALVGNPVAGHFQADAKKTEAVKESAKATVISYETMAATQIEHTAVLKSLLDKVANLAIEVQRQRDRDAVRRKKTRAPSDTAKVQGAQDKAAETLHAIKVDANKVAKALVPPPATLPKEPPSTPAAPSPDAK
jgi:hypothetical protein